MEHKPGHLNFDNVVPAKDKAKTPSALDFGSSPSVAVVTSHNDLKKETIQPKSLFGEPVISSSPALVYAKAHFPEITNAFEQKIEVKIRQLVPWKNEVVANWASKSLNENATLTTRVSHFIKRFSGMRISELADRATRDAQNTDRTLINKIFSKNKILSYKAPLTLAKSQLAQVMLECEALSGEAIPSKDRLGVNLVALIAAYESISKPSDDTIESLIHSKRILLQQSMQQADLIHMQLQELKANIAAQVANIDQLLLVTIPAFEMSNASR